jgi:hypothetical protein
MQMIVICASIKMFALWPITIFHFAQRLRKEVKKYWMKRRWKKEASG